MKAFIIAALSADGYIAHNAHELTDWTSKEDKKLFVELTKRAGVMVMGRSTFDTIGRALPGRKTVVYSSRPVEAEGVEVTQEPPQQLLARLSAEGYGEVAIVGGRSIYNQFLEAGVVDELYLTIEPLVLGSGVNLATIPKTMQLKLKELRKLNDDTVLVRYKVN